MRAALDRLHSVGEGESALRLAGALSNMWYLRGHTAEGLRRFKDALAADTRPTAARAKALNGAATLALTGGDTAACTRLAEESAELNRTVGDAWGIAFAEFLTATLAFETGDAVAAERLFAASTGRFRELGNERYELLASYDRALAVELLGDRERARRLFEEILARSESRSVVDVQALSLLQLASIAYDRGDTGEALSMLKDALVILRDRGDHLGVEEGLSYAARVLASGGQDGTAVRLLAVSETLREQVGIESAAEVASRNAETLHALRGRLDEEALATAWETGRALTVDEAVALALEA
jgi:tetratricopeptide (TPR) repeat protein